MSTLAIVVLVLLVLGFFGSIPTWGYSRNWSWRPSGGLGLLLVIFVILWLTGVLRF